MKFGLVSSKSTPAFTNGIADFFQRCEKKTDLDETFSRDPLMINMVHLKTNTQIIELRNIHLNQTSIFWVPKVRSMYLSLSLSIYIYMGVSVNGGIPKTPQNDHF